MTRIELDGRDVVGIRAANPGPLTLTGTNSWIVGRDPAWLIDPGPDLPEHVAALAAEITARGGLGGILLTHDHIDHSEAVASVRGHFGGDEVELAAARGEVTVRLADGDRIGPFTVQALRGHAEDHLVYLADGVAYSGDAVLGEGSVFIAPDPGALTDYLAGLARLRERAPALIAPGHGPPVEDPDAKLGEYIAHRNEREARLLDALERGGRSIDELLDAAWSEVPDRLRFAAAITLAAHLDKLEAEGRLPAGVQRPQWPPG